jgi:iron complex transport system ATP-binding protein
MSTKVMVHSLLFLRDEKHQERVDLMALIEVDRVSFGYREVKVLEGLSLTVPVGGVVVLLGPNGSGKTTLLKLLLGLLRPQRGTIRFQDSDICSIPARDLARQLDYVPQVHREAFGYRVFDVVLMGRMPHTSFFSRYVAGDLRSQGVAREALHRPPGTCLIGSKTLLARKRTPSC